nr:hypothetical transcript [Hymenolepis microstoma]
MSKNLNFVKNDRPEVTEDIDFRVHPIKFAFHRDDENPPHEISMKVGGKSVKFVIDAGSAESTTIAGSKFVSLSLHPNSTIMQYVCLVVGCYVGAWGRVGVMF